MKFKVVPTYKSNGNKARGASKNPPAEMPMDTPMTQGADNDLPTEEKLDSSETAPNEVIAKLPERHSKKGFRAMLHQIAKESEFDEVDRSIGNYSGSKNCPNVWLFQKEWSVTNQINYIKM